MQYNNYDTYKCRLPHAIRTPGNKDAINCSCGTRATEAFTQYLSLENWNYPERGSSKYFITIKWINTASCKLHTFPACHPLQIYSVYLWGMHGSVIWYPAPSAGNADRNNSPAHTMWNTSDLLLTTESVSGGLVHEFLFTQYIKGTLYAFWYKYLKLYSGKFKININKNSHFTNLSS